MRRFFRRGRLDAERAREMQAHIDHHADDLIAAGYSRERARQEARQRFGNPAVIREEIYQMNSVPILEPLIRDLRYAGRMLRKTPGFTAIALATLAIGIGVNTAVFTVVNTLLLKPLPYPDPARLATVSVLIRSPRGVNENTSVDGATFLAVRGVATTVDTAVSAGGFNLGVNLVAQGVAANVKQGRVSAGYFSVLGVRPFMGREFNAEEDRAGGPPVAVLSHGLWTRVFRADPAILGQPIELKGEPYTVVGVMPEGFTTGTSYDVWTPVRPSETGEGGGSNYGMIVRLRPGVSWQEATAEVDRLGGSKLLLQYQNAKNKDELTASAKLVPLQESATESIRQPLVMLWGAVGVVLLIACVNIAGLLLARSALRRREIATRLALGSSRAVVIRQLLVESAVLALAGGVLGLAVGEAVLSILLRLSTDVFPVGYPIALDGRVLGLTLLLALTTSVLFGLVPALHATRVDVQRALQESGSRAVAGGSGRWRRVLVAGEIALSVILLTGAGLLVRTFVQLRSLDPGFDPTNVTTASVSLQDKRYDDAAKANRLFAETLAEIRRQPGVVAAGISLGLPYTRLLNLGWGRVEGATEDDKGGGANVSYITPGYFEALRVPVRTGRLFGDADTDGSLPVAIVNDAFVQRFYRGQSVVGLHIAVAGARRQIVGVVGNTRTRPSGIGGDGSALPTPYIINIPAAQTPTRTFTLVHTWFSPAWVVQSAGSVAGVQEAIRQAVAKVDPLLPIAKIESMSDVQGAALASQRFRMTLVLGLGVVALLLAAIGIHGLIASSVTERTRELGVRLALGASSGQVMKDVVVPGLLLAAVGVAIGTVGALAGARMMQAFIWGVQPRDPLTLLAVIATLLVVALFASVIPALRVLRLDPALTLRAE
jgi:predicted permease